MSVLLWFSFLAFDPLVVIPFNTILGLIFERY